MGSNTSLMEEKNNNFLSVPGQHPKKKSSFMESGIRGAHSGKVYYEGEWMDGKPHGKGKIYLPDGSYFEGGFHRGEIEC